MLKRQTVEQVTGRADTKEICERVHAHLMTKKDDWCIREIKRWSDAMEIEFVNGQRIAIDFRDVPEHPLNHIKYTPTEDLLKEIMRRQVELEAKLGK